RGGRSAHPRIAARGPPGNEDARVPARHERCRWHALRLSRAMPRYKLTIEYDGRPFVGWQIQDNGPSVQGVLAAAVEAFCGERVTVQGAGPTHPRLPAPRPV